MTYELLSRHLRNMIFSYEQDDIKYINAIILKYYADYGRCRPMATTLLKSSYLYLYPEFANVFKLNKLGINLSEEPFNTMIEDTIADILRELFNNDEKIIKSRISDKQTHFMLNQKLANLYTRLQNCEEYQKRINQMLYHIEEIIGSDKLSSLMSKGINSTSAIYIIPYINEFGMDEDTLCTCLSLSTDEQKLVYSTMVLLKIRNKSDEERDRVFNYIQNGQLNDLYHFYRTLLYENEGLYTVDNVLDTLDTKDNMTLSDAKAVRDYLIPYNNYITHDERQLLVIRQGHLKYKNHDNTGYALAKKHN